MRVCRKFNSSCYPPGCWCLCTHTVDNAFKSLARRQQPFPGKRVDFRTCTKKNLYNLEKRRLWALPPKNKTTRSKKHTLDFVKVFFFSFCVYAFQLNAYDMFECWFQGARIFGTIDFAQFFFMFLCYSIFYEYDIESIKYGITTLHVIKCIHRYITNKITFYVEQHFGNRAQLHKFQNIIIYFARTFFSISTRINFYTNTDIIDGARTIQTSQSRIRDFVIFLSTLHNKFK